MGQQLTHEDDSEVQDKLCIERIFVLSSRSFYSPQYVSFAGLRKTDTLASFQLRKETNCEGKSVDSAAYGLIKLNGILNTHLVQSLCNAVHTKYLIVHI
jgi:hypothetical protein